MKDIKINTAFMKIQYGISWMGFVLLGFIVVWIIVLFLANYGKVTSNDVDKKKSVLNKTWQKFVFIYGSIVGDLFLIALIIDLIQIIFTGTPM
jgi:uncharacterized membrane protein